MTPRRPAPATSIQKLDRLARVLDDAVAIPGTNVRFGLDALIGLVPGIGDVAGAAMAGYVVLAGVRLGAPTTVLLRMLLNIAIDTVVGSVPILGDLFDVGWRANVRNVALLQRHAADPGGTKAASRGVVLLVGLGVLILLALAMLAAWAVLRAGVHLLNSATT